MLLKSTVSLGECISTCERLTPDKFPAKIHSDAKVGLVECCVTLGKYGEAAIFATELPDQYPRR